MLIYKATCSVNEKIYIGKTIGTLEKRKAKHKYEAFKKNTEGKFHRALRKHGWDSFSWEVIDTAIDHDQLNIKENYWIRFFNSRVMGYNSTDGGDGQFGFRHSEESKLKVSQSRKGLAVGENSPNGKLTEEQVIQIKELLVAGVSQYKIAKQIGIGRTTIGWIARGETWGHVEVPGFVPKTKDKKFGSGSNNVNATLSEEVAREIKRELARGELSQRKIAAKFGASEYQVSKIKKGKTWGHLMI